MKRLLLTISIALASLNTSHAITHTLSGPIDPIQALTNPDNVGDGMGTISGDYDETSNSLNYSIEWMDLTSDVTNMHFHLAAPGMPGGVDLGVPGPWSSPQVGSGIVISDTQESNLLSGNWYLNIHTVDFGGGEIRGQVIVTPVPEPTGVGLAMLALLSTLSLCRRNLCSVCHARRSLPRR